MMLPPTSLPPENLTTPTIPTTIEGLPTDGPMGGNPALTVAGVMSAVPIVVGLVVATKLWTPSPDLVQWGATYGLAAAGFAVGGWNWLQGFLTRRGVFSPRSVAEITVVGPRV